MHLRRRIGVLLAALAAVLTVPAMSGTAHAGGGNRQVLFLDPNYSTSSVLVSGTNQYGSHTSGCWNTPDLKTPLSNWWWTGNVDVYMYKGTGCSGSLVMNQRRYISPAIGGYWYAVTSNDGYSTPNAQQVEFYDNSHRVSSIQIKGTNQNGDWATGCWSTPGWDTLAANWWYKDVPNLPVTLGTFTTSNCTGSSQSYQVYFGFGSIATIAVD